MTSVTRASGGSAGNPECRINDRECGMNKAPISWKTRTATALTTVIPAGRNTMASIGLEGKSATFARTVHHDRKVSSQ